jgi:glycosyltransferase involved in cell wall biosynthesis
VYWAAADFGLYACDDNLLARSKSPLRLVEMMGAGLPIVAHRVGETAHYLEDGVSGLLVAPDDDGAFVDAAAGLALDVELRDRLGRNAASRLETQFTWHKLATRVEEMYKALVTLDENG